MHHHGSGEDVLLIAVYVDDILIFSRSQKEVSRLIEHFSNSLEIKDLGEPEFCLGIEFARDKENVVIRQTSYIRDLLKRFGMTDAKPVSMPIDVNVKLTKLDLDVDDEVNKIPYRKLIGGSMYLAVGTRPDIAHAVSVLSQFNTCFGSIHWTAAKRVLRYFKGSSDLGLVFKPS